MDRLDGWGDRVVGRRGRCASPRRRSAAAPASSPPRSRRSGERTHRGPGPGARRGAAARLPRPRRRAGDRDPRGRLVVEDGAVTGVELSGPEGDRVVRAGAVVLATGGFEYDDELVRAFLRGPMRDPAGVPTNTGDGLRMAMRVGAALGAMREAWWVPVVRIPGERADGGSNVHLILRERTLPRSIMVNRSGRRFTNEAANYNALGGAFHQFDPGSFDYVNQPCWLVFDQGFVDAYGGFGTGPGGPAPSWLTRADRRRPRRRARRPGRRAGADRRPLERAGRAGSRRRLRPRRQRLRRLVRRPHAVPRALRDARPARPGPVLRRRAIGSALGTKGGPRTAVDGEVLDVDGESSPACTPPATPWPPHRDGLRRCRRHPRSGAGLRLPGRPGGGRGTSSAPVHRSWMAPT